MEPLLDKDTEGSGDERDEKTQDPKCVDSGGNSRCLERREVEDWDGRVDEISVDGQVDVWLMSRMRRIFVRSSGCYWRSL